MASDPWGISGPTFTGLYVAGFVAAVLLVFLVRIGLTRLGPAGGAGNVGPYAAAYLAGGPKRAIDAAMTALVLAGQVHASRTGKVRRSKNARVTDPYEEAVAGTLRPRGERGKQVAALRGHPATKALVAELKAARLLLGPVRAVIARWVLLLPYAVWVIGLVRVINGSSLGRPVSNLISLLIFSGIALVVLGFLGRGPARFPSPRGHAVLRRLRGEFRASTPRAKSIRGQGAAAKATAVSGVAVLGLAVLPDVSLRSSLLASGVVSSGGGGGGGSSCSSGSSCGSSCGGGGGCGG